MSDTTKLQDDARNRQDDAGNATNSADVYNDVDKDVYNEGLR